MQIVWELLYIGASKVTARSAVSKATSAMHANCAAGVEDIHGLMGFSKKAPKPHLQAAYFKTLTRIFFVSGAYLFHAYAWQKLYILTKNQKKLPVS